MTEIVELPDPDLRRFVTRCRSLVFDYDGTLAKSGRVYGPENLGSLDITKPWCEGKPGSGPGSWLELDFTAEPGRVEAAELLLKIQPGYQKSDRLFVSHARPASRTTPRRSRSGRSLTTPGSGRSAPVRSFGPARSASCSSVRGRSASTNAS